VSELGDREYGFVPENSIPFKNVIPLEEIIAETYDVGVGSKKVLATYEAMVAAHPEFDILLDLSKEEIAKISDKQIAESVIRVREGNVHIEGGYDGIFGKIHIYGDKENPKHSAKKAQTSLF
jgi:DNA helicase-2/ATP-dependent DNA helicase PcrA